MLKKWAFITGATAGIGEATARRLAGEGYALILNGRRLDRLEKLQAELPTETSLAPFDVRDRRAVEHFATNQKELLKKVDVLVNNAGLAKGTEKLQDGDPLDWEIMIDTNVKGLLYLTRAILPHMLERKSGHIVNLGSVAGRWVYPGGAVYCATKFAVRALSEGLRMDLLGTPIRVTNIEPGMAETEFSVVRLGSKEQADRVYQGMRPLTAEDLAETLSWVISRPAHVNIQELVIYPTDQAAVGLVSRKS